MKTTQGKLTVRQALALARRESRTDEVRNDGRFFARYDLDDGGSIHVSNKTDEQGSMLLNLYTAVWYDSYGDRIRRYSL